MMSESVDPADEWLSFPYRVRLDGVERWLIWQTRDDGSDRFIADDLGGVPMFVNQSELQRYASQRGFTIDADDTTWCVDLDIVARWLCDARAEGVDCVQFLNAWNLFWDIATTLGLPFRDRDPKAQKVYGKLFWGNNLPAVTPPGCWYEPVWAASDIVRMKQVLRRGLQWFRDATRFYA